MSNDTLAALKEDSFTRPALFAGLLVAVLFVMRLLAPSNLLDQDQENPAIYVLDAVQNGHWICQHDLSGGITSKPPFYTWCAALVALACRKVNLFALYLPGALGLLGSAWLALRFGTRHFGFRAGLIAALACILCTAGLKQMGLARTDGVFAFTVASAALLAFRAWNSGKGWTLFWLMAAAATLTKGPLGLVLAANGLWAVLWEKRSSHPRPRPRQHALGILLYLLITTGWVFLAWRAAGQALIDKLFLKELVFHVVEGEHKKPFGSLIYLSPLYYLARSAPWSLFTYYGLWRLCKHPAADLAERRFERFLFCWFAGGLLLFSLAPHQRGDLLWPLGTAGALLAGREVARLTARLSPDSFVRWTGAAALLASACFSVQFLIVRAKQPFVLQTAAVQRLAQKMTSDWAGALPLTHTDDPAGLQVCLNTFVPPVNFETAADLLRGPDAAFVAVHDLDRLQALLTNAPSLHVLLADDGPVRKLQTRIAGNRPAFSVNEKCAFDCGSLRVRYQGQLLKAAENRLVFARTAGKNEVSLENRGADLRQVRLLFKGGSKDRTFDLQILPGSIQRVNVID